MFLMAEKGIRGEICHLIYQYTKANDKRMKNYEEKLRVSKKIYRKCEKTLKY